MSPPDKMTPPMGVIELFKEVKADLRAAVAKDEFEHRKLNTSIKDVLALNQKQSESLQKIELALGTKQTEASMKQTETKESGKTKRAVIAIIGSLLALILTAVITHFAEK